MMPEFHRNSQMHEKMLFKINASQDLQRCKIQPLFHWPLFRHNPKMMPLKACEKRTDEVFKLNTSGVNNLLLQSQNVYLFQTRCKRLILTAPT